MVVVVLVVLLSSLPDVIPLPQTSDSAQEKPFKAGVAQSLRFLLPDVTGGGAAIAPTSPHFPRPTSDPRSGGSASAVFWTQEHENQVSLDVAGRAGKNL